MDHLEYRMGYTQRPYTTNVYYETSENQQCSILWTIKNNIILKTTYRANFIFPQSDIVGVNDEHELDLGVCNVTKSAHEIANSFISLKQLLFDLHFIFFR